MQYLPRLTRWAALRLPANSEDRAEPFASGVLDRVLAEAGPALSSEGAFLLHVRKELAQVVGFVEDSTLARDVGLGAVRRYERALGRLDDVQRQAIVGRLEMSLTYDELAGILAGSPGETTIQAFVARAILALAEEMAHREAAAQDAGR